KSNRPFIKFNDHYWYFQTNGHEEKFCYTIPINNNELISYDWAELLQNISIWLFIIVVILYITSLVKLFPGNKVIEFLDNLSIMYRIIGIFTMASIFPVLMTLVIGTSLLSDKQSVIEKNILSESLDVIYNMENQGDVLQEKTNAMSEDLRNAVRDAYSNNQPIDYKLFNKYLSKYSISPALSRLDVRDSDVNTIFTMDDRETQGGANIFDIICRIVLKLHCPKRLSVKSIKISPAELVSESVLSTDELGFATLIRQRNKQFFFRVGAFPTLWYWDIYPELPNGPAFVCITTQMITTFSQHIKEYIYSLPFRKDNIQLAVFVNSPHYVDELITPHQNLPKEKILNIANTTFNTNKVLFRTINIDGQPYWITSKHEKHINCHVLMNIVSQKERLAVLEPFKWQIGLIGVFALTISLFGAWYITRLIILPVGDLSKGILAIRKRNKEFSIPIRRKDEFGELAKAFNQVIKDFDELEYGKIIQESLLPSSAPKIEGYDIAYFTVSATDLAGDYHDNVILDDGRLSVILGDVSGHGISASLAMAMAKATFNYAKSKKVKFPEEFMDMLNTMFNKELKSRNKLMTLISMVLNPQTGEVIFDNAGQSYPAYYSAATHSIEEMKMPSLPLGGMKKRKKKPITKQMEPGDAFIFYTDGIIEASSEKGEMFGYERFFAKFTEQMKLNISAKEAIANIYQTVEDFRESGHHSDDITLIIVKRK
ncbi:MAG: SpoIIE family protein phosphatase, partial [Candidatus Riflebacteria bacterium]|nr:SpoIIE family protein phosphatase [Candidatus Riflebacteria bacterium]